MGTLYYKLYEKGFFCKDDASLWSKRVYIRGEVETGVNFWHLAWRPAVVQTTMRPLKDCRICATDTRVMW